MANEARKQKLSGLLSWASGGKQEQQQSPAAPSSKRKSPYELLQGMSAKPSQPSARPFVGGRRSVGESLYGAVEWVESRGRVNAVSPKGAIGPMQTMPNTLVDPGFGVKPAKDRSVGELRRVGRDYLDAMVGKYGLEGGLAAYNWGPGNWNKALDRAGGDVKKALQSAPKETREYVPKVLGRLR